MGSVVTRVYCCAAGDQRIGQRVVLHVRASHSVALIEQDVGDAAHRGAGDADDVVVSHKLRPQATRWERCSTITSRALAAAVLQKYRRESAIRLRSWAQAQPRMKRRRQGW